MKKILKKVLDEIQKPEPNLSYIRGLLEAIVEEESIVLNPLSFSMKDIETGAIKYPGIETTIDPDMPPIPKSLQK